MSGPPSARADRRRLIRVVLYYVLLAVAVVLLVRYVPAARELLDRGTLQSLREADLETFGGQAAVGAPVSQSPGSGAVLGAASMLAALILMIPVTWIYMVTRRHRGFNESVIHTLLILPVAVTGIVMIVQNSLALAFSLAGIVAAVRFRTTLEDTKDAVYVFLAIGIGLACGVQAFGLALVLSVVVNGVVLFLWRSRFGNPYAEGGDGGLALGDVLAGPGSAATARMVGDPALIDASAPADLAEVLERATRMERYISEERIKKKRSRINTLLLIHATEAGAAQAHVESILEELAERWRLAEAVPGPAGHTVLEYLARFDQPGAEGVALDRARQAPGGVVAAAEVRSLRGLKKRS